MALQQSWNRSMPVLFNLDHLLIVSLILYVPLFIFVTQDRPMGNVTAVGSTQPSIHYIFTHYSIYILIFDGRWMDFLLLFLFHLRIHFNWLGFLLVLGQVLQTYIGGVPANDADTSFQVEGNLSRLPQSSRFIHMLSSTGIVPFQKWRFVILRSRTFGVESFVSNGSRSSRKKNGSNRIQTLDLEHD